MGLSRFLSAGPKASPDGRYIATAYWRMARTTRFISLASSQTMFTGLL